MEHIYEIIGNLLAVVALGLLAWVMPKVRAWLDAHTSKTTQAPAAALPAVWPPVIL